MSQQLRPYQNECVQAVLDAREAGYTRVLYTMATGTGKTTTFAQLTKQFLLNDWKVLILAHRVELITQAYNRVKDHCDLTEWDIGTEIAQYHAPSSSKVVVGSIMTVKGAHRLPDFKPDAIIVDEGHHGASVSYQKLAERHGVKEGECFYVGLTATPRRTDRKSLYAIRPDGKRVQLIDKKTNRAYPADEKECVFQKLVYEYSILSAINDGWLVPVVGHVVKTKTDLSSVKTGTDGDFQDGQLEKAVDNLDRTMLAINAWKEVAVDRPTLVFCAGVEHAHHSAELWRQAGYEAKAIDGKTDSVERFEAIRDFKSGKLQLLMNCGIFIEGTDLPTASCIVHLRPTKSWNMYVQISGRGTRPLPGIVDDSMTAEDRRREIGFSAKPDCIAEGTLILTDVGLVPIEQVSRNMKVWDGIQFSTHSGIIYKGIQEVIDYAGVTGTPDHKIWTCTGWKTLSWCKKTKTPVAVTGIGRKTVRESDGYFCRCGTSRRPQNSAFARSMQMRKDSIEASRVCSLPATRVPSLRISAQCPVMVSSARTWRKAEMHQSEKLSLRAIRRAGDRIQVFKRNRDGCMGSGETGAAQRIRVGQNRQQRSLRRGEHTVFHSSTEREQPARQKVNGRTTRISIGSSRDRIFRQRDNPKFQSRNVMARYYISPLTTTHASARPIQRTARVFDILNAGPDHRFTANGILVSNCILLDLVDITEINDLCTAPSILDLPANLDLQGQSLTDAQKMLEEFEEIKDKVVGECPRTFQELQTRLQQVSLIRDSDAKTKTAWMVSDDGFRYRHSRPGYQTKLISSAPGEYTLTVTQGKDVLLEKKSRTADKQGVPFKFESYLDAAARRASEAIERHAEANMPARGTLTRLTPKQCNVLRRNGYDNKSIDSLPYKKARAIIDRLMTEYHARIATEAAEKGA